MRGAAPPGLGPLRKVRPGLRKRSFGISWLRHCGKFTMDSRNPAVVPRKVSLEPDSDPRDEGAVAVLLRPLSALPKVGGCGLGRRSRRVWLGTPSRPKLCGRLQAKAKRWSRHSSVSITRSSMKAVAGLASGAGILFPRLRTLSSVRAFPREVCVGWLIRSLSSPTQPSRRYLKKAHVENLCLEECPSHGVDPSGAT